MSCPYFRPVTPQGRDSGPENAMLPLGGVWDGLCCAAPADPWQPDLSTLQRLCNLGYARGNCGRFPGGDGPDAVRFAISGDDGVTVRLYYVIERDHHPFAHGPLDHPDAPVGNSSPLLAPQAGAYLHSYLRRKREASRP
jgi:hypothetical protein